jgi:hypothetical protein
MRTNPPQTNPSAAGGRCCQEMQHRAFVFLTGQNSRASFQAPTTNSGVLAGLFLNKKTIKILKIKCLNKKCRSRFSA